MAETTQQFLTKNSGIKLVILTGIGHVRKKYGIPERLFRRNSEPFTVIVQDEEIENGIAKNPAEKAGLQKGDIIKRFSGKPIESVADLKLVLFCSEMRNTVKIQILRDKKMLNKKIELFNFGDFSPHGSIQKRKRSK